MANEGGERGATDPVGSSLPFDPVLGARLFGEIQTEGLRAASALVDRLVHLVDGSSTTAPVDDGTEIPESDPEEPVGAEAVLPWFELWSDLVGRTAETMQRFRGAGVGPAGEGVQVAVDGGLTPSRPLSITVGPSGRGAGEMWLHNGTAIDHGELVPRCGPLSDVEGGTLAVDVEIDPPKVDGLPPRSSRGFLISITVAPSTDAGTYRGTVQVRGAEAVWMPIEVVVPARPS